MGKEAPTRLSGRSLRKDWSSSHWDNVQSEGRGGPLEWWYNFTAPAEPPENATPRDREIVRYGRLSSVILLIMFCFGLALLPNALLSTNHAFLPILLSAMAVNVGALLLNRRGKIIAVGLIMVTVVELAFILVVLTSTAMSSRGLGTFDLIVVTELMAVSLLPPKSVFPVAICNALFTWAAITFMPHTPDLTFTAAGSYYAALVRPLTLQIIIAIVTYLWAQGATRAIARAEMVAALERAMAEQDRAVAEQKQQLDFGIQQILQTHIQVANGNFNARAPLARDNVLWQVAHNLNNLLARVQRSAQSEYDLQRASAEVPRLVESVRYAKTRRRPIQTSRSGTILDPIAQELTGNYIGQP